MHIIFMLGVTRLTCGVKYMNMDIIEGYIEVEGRYPILITALHGFGSGLFKDLAKVVRKICKKAYRVCRSTRAMNYYSAVDMYTWEAAFKAGVAENAWIILPTLSKVDKLENMEIPDYNLNKYYAKLTPLWGRVSELVDNGVVRVLIDLHGMRNVRKWPDICISTAGYRSASKNLSHRIAEYFKNVGFSVKIDYPFSGGAFIRYFGNPPRTEALAIEFKRNIRYFKSRLPSIVANVIRIVKEYIHSEAC